MQPLLPWHQTSRGTNRKVSTANGEQICFYSKDPQGRERSGVIKLCVSGKHFCVGLEVSVLLFGRGLQMCCFLSGLLNWTLIQTVPSSSWSVRPRCKKKEEKSWNCNPHEMKLLFTAKSRSRRPPPPPPWLPSSLNFNMYERGQFISTFTSSFDFHLTTGLQASVGGGEWKRGGGGRGAAVSYYIWTVNYSPVSHDNEETQRCPVFADDARIQTDTFYHLESVVVDNNHRPRGPAVLWANVLTSAGRRSSLC